MGKISGMLTFMYKTFMPLAMLFYLALVLVTPLNFEPLWFVVAFFIDIFNEIRE